MQKDFKSQEQIDAMRKRLYDRGTVFQKTERHRLSDEKVEVSGDWAQAEPTPDNTTDLRKGMDPQAPTTSSPTAPEEEKTPKRAYRRFVLIGSFLIFFFVATVSSLFLYFGGNQISNDNIDISVQGPSSIGGGEVAPLQVTVTNNNSVPIESATLIVKYPVGTRSVGDSPRNLFEERIPIDDIEPGEVKNVPVQVAIYGEENAEKRVEATIEYRVDGSSGMFYKDADALTMLITSSPLVLRIESVEKVASGQLIDITMTAVSNASSPLYNVLVTAAYPNGFAYESSTPEPVFGQNVWRIDELLPEESKTIELQGVVSGLTEETFRINFDAGPADPDDQYTIGASLADARTDFLIERPFIDVDVDVNGETDNIILSEQEMSSVNVDITNTLNETVYDMVVEVVPGGNSLDETSIRSGQGFYDSNRNAVVWETSNNSTFDRILPGGTRSLRFDVVPDRSVLTTASYELVVNVYARRVAETSAQETLIGNERTTAKYSSTITIGSQAGRDVGPFNDSGPIPPRVGEVTTYTVTLVAEAGANDMDNTVVETSLPIYVNWLDQYEASGTVTYNSVSKELQWVVGDIPLGERREFTFQVSLQPSVSQVDLSPTLVNRQSIKANDAFTGQLLRDTASAVTTELSTEMGYERENGEVRR